MLPSEVGLQWRLIDLAKPHRYEFVAKTETAVSPEEQPKIVDGEQFTVDLRDPLLAALLAWLIPGLGHIYQRRTAKGVLFMVCILGTFLYGWGLGGGKVVYAAWQPEIRRWPYLCQVWAGLPALPALAQRTMGNPFGETFMAAPKSAAELAAWQKELSGNFELGTVFTMIAGLLNLLAIFDAGAGPVGSVPEKEDKKKPDDRPPPDDESGDDDPTTTGQSSDPKTNP